MASAHRSVAFFHFLKPETLVSGRSTFRLQAREGRKRREGSSGPLVLWNAETVAAAASAENVESNLGAEKKERRKEGRKEGGEQSMPSIPFHAGGGRQHKFARIF